jgi:hypothetical protein
VASLSFTGLDPSTCRRGLAEGYLRDLYKSLDGEDAISAWNLLQGVLNGVSRKGSRLKDDELTTSTTDRSGKDPDASSLRQLPWSF